MKTNVHPNSIAACHEGRAVGEFSERAQEILAALRVMRVATDRQIAERCGYSHKSAVQPRITELVQRGVLTECGDVLDPITQKKVRVVRIVAAQGELHL